MLRARLIAAARDPRGAVALVLVAALLWGSAFPAIKRGYAVLALRPDDFRGVLAFAGVRFLVAGVMLLVGAWIAGLARRPPPRQVAALLGLGLVQTTLQYSAFYIGLANTSAVKAAVIVASGSFFLAFFSPLFYPGDRLSIPRVGGLVVGFAGVVLAASSRTGGSSGSSWFGDALVLVTGLCSAAASLMSKRVLKDVHPVVVNGYQATFGAAVLLVAALLSGPLPDRVPVSGELVWLTVFLAAITAVAFSLYYVVVKYHDLSRVAAYRFLIPVSAVALSALFVPEEGLGPRVLLAAVLTAAGIWIVNRPGRHVGPAGPGAL